MRRALRKQVRASNWDYLTNNYSGEAMDSAYSHIPEYMQLGATQQERIAALSKIIGKGGYWGKRFGRWLGGLTGNRTIQNIAGTVGDYLGDAVADMVPYGNQMAAAAESIAKLSGHGAYSVGDSSNLAMQVGTFAPQDVERINIKSREYLGAVNGSAAFNIYQLVLNPGLISSFPQLSKLAMHYEQYKWNGIVFWYHSTSGESTNSADTAIGEILMANQSDSTESVPADKSEFVRLDSAKQAKPSIDQLHGIECKGAYSTIKYIRHGDPIESTQDANRFDHGKFLIATEGMNAAVTRVGELWVTYDVDLIRSRDSRGQEVGAFYARHSLTDASTGSQSALFSNITIAYKSLDCSLSPTTNLLVFPRYVTNGDYLVQIALYTAGNFVSSAFTAVAPTIATFSNCSLLTTTLPTGRDNLLNQAGQGGDAMDNTAMAQYIIRVNAPGSAQAYIEFASNSVWPSIVAATSGKVFISVIRLPQGMFTY